MLMRQGTLRIEDHERGGRHTWLMTGRLTRATATAFELMVGLLCEQGASSLAVDVRALTFLDSGGLAAIMRARELCGEHGCELTLISLSTLSTRGPRPVPAGRLPAGPIELAHTGLRS